MAEKLRQVIEGKGDQLADLHLWRLGPGHLAAIISIITKRARGPSGNVPLDVEKREASVAG
jgi:hypothetical protein